MFHVWLDCLPALRAPCLPVPNRFLEEASVWVSRKVNLASALGTDLACVCPWTLPRLLSLPNHRHFVRRWSHDAHDCQNHSFNHGFVCWINSLGSWTVRFGERANATAQLTERGRPVSPRSPSAARRDCRCERISRPTNGLDAIGFVISSRRAPIRAHSTGAEHATAGYAASNCAAAQYGSLSRTCFQRASNATAGRNESRSPFPCTDHPQSARKWICSLCFGPNAASATIT
jgi:hypothetical protein